MISNFRLSAGGILQTLTTS